jgi:hypothetical protein
MRQVDTHPTSASHYAKAGFFVWFAKIVCPTLNAKNVENTNNFAESTAFTNWHYKLKAFYYRDNYLDYLYMFCFF